MRYLLYFTSLFGNGLTGYYFNSDSYENAEVFIAGFADTVFTRIKCFDQQIFWFSKKCGSVLERWGNSVPGYYPVTEAYSWLLLNFFYVSFIFAGIVMKLYLVNLAGSDRGIFLSRLRTGSKINLA